MRLHSHRLSISVSTQHTSCVDDIENYKNGLYDQATKMAVLLLSAHPLPDQYLLPLHPPHRTDLPTYLSLTQLVTVLTFTSELF